MAETPSESSAKIPSAVVKRIMTEGGAQRVSADAVAALQQALLDYGKHVTTQAVAAAEHAKRTTVKGEDVQLALKGQ